LNILTYARCPHCGREAQGIKEVQLLFGYRKTKKDIKIVQSWCRKCRTKKVVVCPRCGKKAKREEDIIKIFGFRKMANGLIREQSWCRTCRSKK
jgi:hypothetical protein